MVDRREHTEPARKTNRFDGETARSPEWQVIRHVHFYGTFYSIWCHDIAKVRRPWPLTRIYHYLPTRGHGFV